MRGRLFAGDPLVGMHEREIGREGLTRGGRVVGARAGIPVVHGSASLSGVASVVWCTGFRPDYDWIDMPVIGIDGYPVHRRGIALGVPGLAFVGMRFQARLGSALLGGVGEDAAHVVNELTAHLRNERAFPWNTASASPSRS